MDKATNISSIKSGIYAITHIPTCRAYIGSAVNLPIRIRRHKYDLQNGLHDNKHLQNAWDKYGSEEFIFSPIEYVTDKERLIEREQHHIDNRPADSLFNMCLMAGSCLGIKKTMETKQKHRDAMTGKPKTTAHRKAIGISAKGRIISDSQKAKISASLTGRHQSEETIQKIKNGLTGIKRTAETKLLIGEASKSRSAETRKKIGDAARNRSESSLMKMSLAKKGKPLSQEHKAKISASVRAAKLAKKQPSMAGGSPSSRIV